MSDRWKRNNESYNESEKSLVGESNEEAERRRLFSLLIFGIDIDAANNDDVGSQTSSIKNNSRKTTDSEKKSNNKPTITKRTTTRDHDINDGKKNVTTVNRLQGVLTQIDKFIPQNINELRETGIYRNARNTIQWQRDNYFVGYEYANWRKHEKEQKIYNVTSVYYNNTKEIPYDPTALVHTQLTKLAADFIPTPTVQKALTPIITSLPMGPLYIPARDSLVSIILSQQRNLEYIMKDSLIQFLNNPINRESIKNSTQGILIEHSTKESPSDTT